MNWIIGEGSVCLIKNLTGLDCSGCGMTRAIFSVIKLNFIEAYQFNKSIVVVFPLLSFLWLKQLKILLKRVEFYR